MRKIMPRELVIGSQIVTNVDQALMGARPKTERVSQVEHYACSSNDTHVNNDSCYKWSIGVWVA